MTYEELRDLAKSSKAFEGIPYTAFALRMAQNVEPDIEDVRTAAIAAFELGRSTVTREQFRELIGDN